jgi:AGZA family xanthine/uracil permease-like MFS transporter
LKAVLDRYFGITSAGSTVGREVRAGVTTFLTMAYILFVNPDILAKAIPLEASNAFGQLLAATAIAAAVGTLGMGLFARFPFATAPGMGLNAYFTYAVVLGMGVPWRTALGCVFLSGVIAVGVAAFGLRESVIKAFPLTIKRATAAGIGLFLAIIGCVNAGIVVDSPATLVTLGSMKSPSVLLALAGIAVTGTLLALRVRGAILWGIVGVTTIAVLSGAPVYQGQAFAGFTNGIVAAPAWPVDLMLALDLKGALSLGLASVVLAMFFVDFFDTAGTLMGLAEKAGFTDGQGNLPRGSKAFVADGMATTLGALVGTSSTTTYIESMSGIEDGGRTGLTSVTVAALFLLSVCLWPLASAVPAAATAPALILVGAMMMGSAASIDWNDYREAVPAFLTMIAMPLTYSIANGIAFGIISYTVIHALSGRAKQVHWIMYLLTVALGAHYAWG